MRATTQFRQAEHRKKAFQVNATATPVGAPLAAKRRRGVKNLAIFYRQANNGDFDRRGNKLCPDFAMSES
jgi:hypothetical protein